MNKSRCFTNVDVALKTRIRAGINLFDTSFRGLSIVITSCAIKLGLLIE